MKIVYVQWVDSYCNEGWHNQSGIEFIKTNRWIVESIGWLIEETGQQITLCQSSASIQDACSEILQVPMEAILDWRILAPPEAEPDDDTG